MIDPCSRHASHTQGHMGGSPDLHAAPAPSVGVYSSVSSKKKMRINADAAQRSATAIRFVPNVMLLEAAARNDVEEGGFDFVRQYQIM